MTKPILFIFTSADKLLDGSPTGWYLPEAAHPYYALRPHFEIEAASTAGGPVPVDQFSVKTFTDDESVRFLKDKDTQELVKDTKKIGDVKAEDYAAVFVIGGHGPMIDLAPSKEFARLVQDFYAQKKPISAVCHGPSALVNSVKPNSSESILKGISVTGFSNSEEAQTPYNDFEKILPFSLEDKLNELSGGKYVKAQQDWASNVVWDGGILTGQNPGSAKDLGQKLRDVLLGKA